MTDSVKFEPSYLSSGLIQNHDPSFARVVNEAEKFGYERAQEELARLRAQNAGLLEALKTSARLLQDAHKYVTLNKAGERLLDSINSAIRAEEGK